MLLRTRPDAPKPPFAADVLARLPLAEAVLSVWAYLAQDDFLAQVYHDHRGRQL